MKILHICSKETYQKHWMNSPQGHYLDLPNGQIVLIAEWGHTAQNNFESETDCLPLPHFLESTAIGEKVAGHLAHLGIKPEHKTFEAMLILKKTHAAFSPSQF